MMEQWKDLRSRGGIRTDSQWNKRTKSTMLTTTPRRQLIDYKEFGRCLSDKIATLKLHPCFLDHCSSSKFYANKEWWIEVSRLFNFIVQNMHSWTKHFFNGQWTEISKARICQRKHMPIFVVGPRDPLSLLLLSYFIPFGSVIIA